MTTIKDIARASGVCPATVSQVLSNGRRPVHPKTRERVMHAAQSLDYSPNAVARGLVQKRMNTIGLVFLHGDTPAHSNPFLMGVLDGILSVSTRRNQRTTLCTLPSWDTAGEHLSEFSDGRCDGVLLLVPPAGCPLVERLHRRKVPFVVVNGADRSGHISYVDINNVRAAYEMTDALLQMGHRRIGFVHHERQWHYPYAVERQQGYREAMTAWGCYDPALADLTLEELVQENLAPLQLETAGRPTALFCSYDVLALLMLEALRGQGIAVPEDLSIVGFDDIPGAATSLPPLTTVRQPMAQIGETAAETLLALIESGEELGRHKLLTTELVFRQSTAPPPARVLS